ncbi:hypothetical protein DOTSEDRAFT_68252 [Dothistroma septosporum NZE10]|uniref:Uncharacterized protein n=1 Tax=Dothistroma septosporum (strain NZE10 / CBS 128990) TaxID=675120 RepID=N1Q3Z4_DOTSN|nr:hypothetical protein DOTSEDRAFT_68252 [Dothistroma septosporum NZE10]
MRIFNMARLSGKSTLVSALWQGNHLGRAQGWTSYLKLRCTHPPWFPILYATTCSRTFCQPLQGKHAIQVPGGQAEADLQCA